MHAPAATKKKDVGAKHFLRTRMPFSQSLSACYNTDYTGLIIIDPRVESMKSVIVFYFCNNGCHLAYVMSLASSENNAPVYRSR